MTPPTHQLPEPIIQDINQIFSTRGVEEGWRKRQVFRLMIRELSTARQQERERINEDPYLETNPNIMSGDLVIKGTRIRMSDLLSLLLKGVTWDQILTDYYPWLKEPLVTLTPKE